MLLSWKKLYKKSDNEFRRITGIKKTTFAFLIKLLLPKWKALRLAGGPKPKLKLEEQLLLSLSYWRNYGTYLETGSKYGVSESRAWEISRWIEDILIHEKALSLPGKKALLAEKKYEIELNKILNELIFKGATDFHAAHLVYADMRSMLHFRPEERKISSFLN